MITTMEFWTYRLLQVQREMSVQIASQHQHDDKYVGQHQVKMVVTQIISIYLRRYREKHPEYLVFCNRQPSTIVTCILANKSENPQVK